MIYENQSSVRHPYPTTHFCMRRSRRSFPQSNYSISFSFSFCALVKLVGNLIFTPTMKSPRSEGFLDLGMPRLGYRSVQVGPVGPPLPTLSCLPSMVWTVRRQPVRASLRSISIVCLTSSPSRVNIAWGFCGVVSIDFCVNWERKDLPQRR